MYQICANCVYFRLHYVKLNGRFHETTTGHCTYKRPKMLQDIHRECEHFEKITTSSEVE